MSNKKRFLHGLLENGSIKFINEEVVNYNRVNCISCMGSQQRTL